MTEQIETLVIKIQNLEAEIRANQRILAQYNDDLLILMKETNKTKLSFKRFNVIIKKVISQSFNSTKFKKDYPEEYEKCRVSSKRFDQKKVKVNLPDLYNEYLESSETETLEIERLEEVLPSL